MPKPLFTKLVALAAIGFFCVLFGCVYGLHTKDRIFLIMSILIGCCSIIRTISFYLLVRSGNYLTIVGTCLKKEPALFAKTQHVLLLSDESKEYRISLKKSVKLLQGHRYRLYFKTSSASSPADTHETMQQFQDFLGYEELAEVSK